jgi:hypothetical protein
MTLANTLQLYTCSVRILAYILYMQVSPGVSPRASAATSSPTSSVSPRHQSPQHGGHKRASSSSSSSSSQPQQLLQAATCHRRSSSASQQQSVAAVAAAAIAASALGGTLTVVTSDHEGEQAAGRRPYGSQFQERSQKGTELSLHALDCFNCARESCTATACVAVTQCSAPYM